MAEYACWHFVVDAITTRISNNNDKTEPGGITQQPGGQVWDSKLKTAPSEKVKSTFLETKVEIDLWSIWQQSKHFACSNILQVHTLQKIFFYFLIQN